MKKNIFDTKSIKDLPLELQDNVGRRGLSEHTKLMLSLFEEKSELNRDEILAAMYRKYGLIKNNSWFYSIMYYLKKRKQIEVVPCKKHTYRLP